MQKSKTYFEQIPVEVVKKIAQEIPVKNAIENESVSAVTRDWVTPGEEQWRELAKRVQREQDPNTMIGLVQQLIETLDKEKSPGGRLG